MLRGGVCVGVAALTNGAIVAHGPAVGKVMQEARGGARRFPVQPLRRLDPAPHPALVL